MQTSRFGSLTVNEKEIIYFQRGMLGFPNLKRYLSLEAPGFPAFRWLQAVDDGEVAFLLANPFSFFAGYEVELSADNEKLLQVDRPEEVSVYVVISAKGNAASMTANLVGPVIVAHDGRRGLQVVLEGSSYSTRHPLFPIRDRLKAAGGGG